MKAEPYIGQKYSTMSHVQPHLYLGDYLDGQDCDLLATHEIDLVINCTHRPHVHDACEHACLMQDDYSPIDHDKLDTFFTVMDENAGKTVLVHCALGINRAPSYVIAWLMRERRWTWERALAFARFRRKIVNPVAYAEESVKAYFRLRYPDLVLTDDGAR